MLNNSNAEKEITHLCLMTNEGVYKRNIGYNDDDYNACTSNDEQEEEETEYNILDDVHDFLNNYSKCKLIKVLLYYIRRQEAYVSKIKDFKKMNFKFS